MQHVSKLLCNHTRLICQPYRFESRAIKGAKGGTGKKPGTIKFGAKEETYFWRKNREYLHYIKEEISKGKSVVDILEEHRKNLEDLTTQREIRKIWQGNPVKRATGPVSGHVQQKPAEPLQQKPAEPLQQKPANPPKIYKKSDKEYVIQIWKEVKNGRPIEEVIEEVRQKLIKEKKT